MDNIASDPLNSVIIEISSTHIDHFMMDLNLQERFSIFPRYEKVWDASLLFKLRQNILGDF